MAIKFSGRSSDYLPTSFINNCLGECGYCYAARYKLKDFYTKPKINTHIPKILEEIKNYPVDIIKPNQTHEKYITWDLSCNGDLVSALHLFDWQQVFDYFKYSERDFGTLATKFVNPLLLTYNPEKKIRIRMSLMPSKLSKTLEPKTSSIEKRINFVNKLYNANYEVHLNFSPVIVYKGWKEDYIELFKQIDSTISEEVKKDLACEVIFLTHNERLHEYNLEENKPLEHLLWNQFQEPKVSSYGGKNVRYERKLKNELVKSFEKLIQEHLNYCKIRYIF